jgi:hypothetical protein
MFLPIHYLTVFSYICFCFHNHSPLTAHRSTPLSKIPVITENGACVNTAKTKDFLKLWVRALYIMVHGSLGMMWVINPNGVRITSSRPAGHFTVMIMMQLERRHCPTIMRLSLHRTPTPAQQSSPPSFANERPASSPIMPPHKARASTGGLHERSRNKHLKSPNTLTPHHGSPAVRCRIQHQCPVATH